MRSEKETEQNGVVLESFCLEKTLPKYREKTGDKVIFLWMNWCSLRMEVWIPGQPSALNQHFWNPEKSAISIFISQALKFTFEYPSSKCLSESVYPKNSTQSISLRTNIPFYADSAAAKNGGGTAGLALIRVYDPRGFRARPPEKSALDPWIPLLPSDEFFPWQIQVNFL